MVAITSASGILALLDEDEVELKTYALERLDGLVNEFWAEVADGISKIETLYETATLPGPTRSLAALVASKLYYHLGDLDESLAFALGAGDRFDVEKVGTGGVEGEYVETVVSQCIDAYVTLRTASETETPAISLAPDGSVVPASAKLASKASAAALDPRMEAIVERMFQRCVSAGEYRQALGIALEARRLDVIESIASTHHRPPQKGKSPSSAVEAGAEGDLLGYLLEASMTVVTKVSFRNQVLRLLVRLFSDQPSGPDYFSITQTFVYLNDPSLASKLLKDLLETKGSAPGEAEENKVLKAYQICFDLAETATQEFLEAVRNSLGPAAAAPVEGTGGMQTEEKEGPALHLERARAILTGEESIKLYLEFLYRNNKADLLILSKTKDALDPRSSLYHSAVSFANAFAHAGTTSDQFLRDNLEWLAKASNWSKFSATAGLGVIHRGNLAQGLQVLQPYLPPEEGSGQASSSFYSEGGSLFALGLIHANHGGTVLDYIRKAMKNNSQSEIIQHGAALGLGVAGMATGNEDIYDDLREILYNDSAIAGEAAGYAMGLVMLGTGSAKAVEEMLQYAHETQHEKIIRGLAIGISLLFYGKEEEADPIIETLVTDKDPILRYGGIYAVAMAYAGTGNNKAIRRLLHVAVSDVNDDVRRAAVTSLGFLLFRTPSQVPRIVQLLSESYNPNVRYGAAIALGIACAGTGLEEAIELLEPMTKDTVDYVKQGSCIALAMILIQQNETLNPKTATVRKLFEKIVGDKHEDAMSKFGAALAQGIIDAGGRNATVSMRSKNGSSNLSAIVGMALFNQFWYWFPMTHFLSLAFTPTAVIGVNSDLKIPAFDLISNTRPSLFAYQPATAPPTEEKVEKVATAVLSTTAKANARAKTKKDKAAAESGDMDTDEKTSGAEASADDAMKTDEAEATATEGKAAEGTEASPSTAAKGKKKEEPAFDKIPNLSRVTPTQLPYITFPDDARFVPVRPLVVAGAAPVPTVSAKASTSAVAQSILQRAEFAGTGAGGGILIVKDKEPGKPAEFLELSSVKDLSGWEPVTAGATEGGAGGQSDAALAAEPIADPPAPFEYDFDD